MPKIPVTNNRECLVQIQVSHGLRAPKKGEPKDVQARIDLIPGLNLVDQKLWEKAKELETVRWWLANEIEPSPAPEAQFEKVGQPYLVEGEPLPDEAPLAKLTLPQAKSIIRDTFDENLLKQWLAEETRAEVRVEITKHMEKITKPKEARPTGTPQTR